jgi:hypothetical protein
LTLVFRHCLTRPPTAGELSALLQFREQQLARLRTGELDAAKIAGDNPPPGVDRAELAAWTTVCRVLLNLDETVTKE